MRFLCQSLPHHSRLAQHPRPTVLTKFGRLVGPVSSSMFVDEGSKETHLPHNIHPSIHPIVWVKIIGRWLSLVQDCQRFLTYRRRFVFWIANQGCHFITFHMDLWLCSVEQCITWSKFFFNFNILCLRRALKFCIMNFSTSNCCTWSMCSSCKTLSLERDYHVVATYYYVGIKIWGSLFCRAYRVWGVGIVCFWSWVVHSIKHLGIKIVWF